MKSPRIVRPLSVEALATGAAAPNDSGSEDQVNGHRLTKLELRELFGDEIKELARQEVEVKEKEIKEKLQKQFETRVNKFESDYEVKSKQLDARLKLAATLVDSLESEKKQSILSTMDSMDTILIEMCLEALYKITAEKEVFEKVVLKTLKTVSAMHAANIKVKVNVSEEAFNLLTGRHKDSIVSSHINLDKSLKAGQIRIDDGLSITESGLLEQLDNLREALLVELRKNYEL
jgi:hypothetical protein